MFLGEESILATQTVLTRLSKGNLVMSFETFTTYTRPVPEPKKRASLNRAPWFFALSIVCAVVLVICIVVAAGWAYTGYALSGRSAGVVEGLLACAWLLAGVISAVLGSFFGLLAFLNADSA